MASPSYITIKEFYTAWDRQLVEQLSTDGSGMGDLSTTNEKLTTNIERASEDVQMAATVGNRYTITDLDDMVTDDRWALKGLVADLTMGHMFRRRGGQIPASVMDAVKKADDTLESLRNGDAVFPIEGNRAAGNPSCVLLTPSSRSRFGMISDSQFFPERRSEKV